MGPRGHIDASDSQNLVILYTEQGKPAAAEAMFQRLLQESEKAWDLLQVTAVLVTRYLTGESLMQVIWIGLCYLFRQIQGN